MVLYMERARVVVGVLVSLLVPSVGGGVAEQPSNVQLEKGIECLTYIHQE